MKPNIKDLPPLPKKRVPKKANTPPKKAEALQGAALGHAAGGADSSAKDQALSCQDPYDEAWVSDQAKGLIAGGAHLVEDPLQSVSQMGSALLQEGAEGLKAVSEGAAQVLQSGTQLLGEGGQALGDFISNLSDTL